MRRSGTSNIFRPSPNQRRVMYVSGSTPDIVRVILYADSRSAEFIRPEAVKHLQGATQRQTLENIFLYVRNNIRYRADAPGHEIVRSPGYLFESGTGDCKSYSIAIAALCRAFGIQYRFRFSAPTHMHQIQHVYVVATTADGKDVYMDAVLGQFDRQPDHMRKVDIRPGDNSNMAAISGGGAYLLESTITLLALVALLFLFAKKTTAE